LLVGANTMAKVPSAAAKRRADSIVGDHHELRPKHIGGYRELPPLKVVDRCLDRRRLRGAAG
jgi:hypothetical protein